MGLISRFFSFCLPAPSLSPDTQTGLDRVLVLVDKKLGAMPGFAARLAVPVAHARAYCAKLVHALPPAIEISRQHFATSPLVHALFATADDIDALFAASTPVRAFLSETVSWKQECFIALLAARRVEKKVFGSAIQGNVLMADVPQSLLLFSNQTLLLPAVDSDAAHAALLEAAFDSLLQTFAGHLDRAREAYTSLQAERELERVRQRTQPTGHEGVAFPERRLAALDERLRERFQSLQPGVVIDELARFLMAPEQALALEPVQMWVSRSGVIQEEGAHSEDAMLVRFMELKSRDRRLHLVLPVRIAYDEARQAIARSQAGRAAREYMLLL
ncbi:MAG: hypothetical protein LBG78_04815 [Azoarcus sp.]|jgi:hypothetical protein|nr:hypothetical protein [Azoarcus sp.]